MESLLHNGILFGLFLYGLAAVDMASCLALVGLCLIVLWDVRRALKQPVPAPASESTEDAPALGGSPFLSLSAKEAKPTADPETDCGSSSASSVASISALAPPAVDGLGPLPLPPLLVPGLASNTSSRASSAPIIDPDPPDPAEVSIVDPGPALSLPSPGAGSGPVLGHALDTDADVTPQTPRVEMAGLGEALGRPSPAGSRDSKVRADASPLSPPGSSPGPGGLLGALRRRISSDVTPLPSSSAAAGALSPRGGTVPKYRSFIKGSTIAALKLRGMGARGRSIGPEDLVAARRAALAGDLRQVVPSYLRSGPGEAAAASDPAGPPSPLSGRGVPLSDPGSSVFSITALPGCLFVVARSWERRGQKARQSRQAPRPSPQQGAAPAPAPSGPPGRDAEFSEDSENGSPGGGSGATPKDLASVLPAGFAEDLSADQLELSPVRVEAITPPVMVQGSDNVLTFRVVPSASSTDAFDQEKWEPVLWMPGAADAIHPSRWHWHEAGSEGPSGGHLQQSRVQEGSGAVGLTMEVPCSALVGLTDPAVACRPAVAWVALECGASKRVSEPLPFPILPPRVAKEILEDPSGGAIASDLVLCLALYCGGTDLSPEPAQSLASDALTRILSFAEEAGLQSLVELCRTLGPSSRAQESDRGAELFPKSWLSWLGGAPGGLLAASRALILMALKAFRLPWTAALRVAHVANFEDPGLELSYRKDYVRRMGWYHVFGLAFRALWTIWRVGGSKAVPVRRAVGTLLGCLVVAAVPAGAVVAKQSVDNARLYLGLLLLAHVCWDHLAAPLSFQAHCTDVRRLVASLPQAPQLLNLVVHAGGRTVDLLFCRSPFPYLLVNTASKIILQLRLWDACAEIGSPLGPSVVRPYLTALLGAVLLTTFTVAELRERRRFQRSQSQQQANPKMFGSSGSGGTSSLSSAAGAAGASSTSAEPERTRTEGGQGQGDDGGGAVRGRACLPRSAASETR